eukprot:GHVL01012438.1.p1 GENE.GHVL01012438.1~~GHVL01012438.1.p1  ORF type:complete len:409 (-),score=33.79 GHVL01012438.1:790-2016(-)
MSKVEVTSEKGQLHLKLKSLIGKGAYGECYEAALPNGEKCCVKRAAMKKGYEKTWSNFEKLSPTLQILSKETNTLMKIHHMSRQSDAGFLVSELCTGPSVLSFIKKHRGTGVPESVTKKIVFDTLTSLKALHSKGIIHRDVKMDNLMFRSDLPDSCCVLLDLDACLKLPDSMELKMVSAVDGATGHVEGTTEYLSPESLHGIETPMRDLWSVGVLLYCLLDTHFPYDPLRCADFRQYHAMLMKPPHINPRVWTPYPEALSLLKSLLTVDHRQRITASDALQHQWFGNITQSRPAPITVLPPVPTPKEKELLSPGSISTPSKETAIKPAIVRRERCNTRFSVASKLKNKLASFSGSKQIASPTQTPTYPMAHKSSTSRKMVSGWLFSTNKDSPSPGIVKTWLTRSSHKN